MATLVGTDYTWIKKWIRRTPEVWAEFKPWSLDKQTFYDALQAIEDYEVAGFNSTPTTSKRTAIEAETGVTTSIRAQYLWLAWVSWRSYKKLG